MNTKSMLGTMGIILVIATSVIISKGEAKPSNCYGVYTYFNEPNDLLERLTYEDALVAQYSPLGTDREVRHTIATEKHDYWNNREYVLKLSDLMACNMDFTKRLRNRK